MRTKLLIIIPLALAIISFGFLYSQGLATNCQNPISFYLYCNSIPQYEQQAMAWINTTMGSTHLPYSANNTILAWWDYGDWINYFGHAGAVLRGDNQLPNLNYETAYMFVDGNQTQLYNFMNKVGAKYLMLEVGLLPKWGALNYLSCIYQNQTNFNVPVGSSPCEASNEPTYLFFPATLSNLNAYCSMSNSTSAYIKAVSNRGQEFCLQTAIPTGSNQAQIDGKIYNYTTDNLIPYLNLMPVGQQAISNTNYDVYLLLYVPNASGQYPANVSVPQFYYSNYYLMFNEGIYNTTLFKQVYPANNVANQVRIYEKR